MKILAMSDTHGKHAQIPKDWMPPADVLVHAGDISNVGRMVEIIDFLDWFSKQPYEHKIFIAGNHDWGFQENYDVMTRIVRDYGNIIYLEDSEVVIGGVKFYGSPWQPEFCNWAFNLPRGEKLQAKWDRIPEDTDVLITHGPPRNILDFVSQGSRGSENVGCANLEDTVLTKLPILKLNIFGHVHSSAGMLIKKNKLFVNAAVLNEQYNVANKPIILDI